MKIKIKIQKLASSFFHYLLAAGRRHKHTHTHPRLLATHKNTKRNVLSDCFYSIICFEPIQPPTPTQHFHLQFFFFLQIFLNIENAQLIFNSSHFVDKFCV
ncbi:unnamed protein product [Ceratitis capitata]|uniref:(Mediterranean fruit fly) hypothetical protein n=1 Tax=Ceratitis capitata TaxID=7213 RepID=A0A811V9V9_CERCA|nr:unnamed protein product [Ceratitis capitata]